MTIITDIVRALYSAVKLRNVRYRFPVYASRRSRVTAGKNVWLGAGSSIDVLDFVCEDGVTVHADCTFCGNYIKIGTGTNFNRGCFINTGSSKMEIGKFCAVSSQVSVWGIDHNYDLPAIQVRFFAKLLHEDYKFRHKGPTFIGNDVLIGERAIVLPGVNLGNGSIIGAGSMVTRDVPDYAIVGGMPAKLIKYRFEKNIIEYLVKLRWWDWSPQKMMRNKEFFNLNLNSGINLREIEKIFVE